MIKRLFLFFLASSLSLSCSTEGDDNGGAEFDNLAQFAALSSSLPTSTLIACSASAEDDSNLVFTFFYPAPGSYNFQYFETDSIVADDKDFSTYKKIELPVEEVFNGYLRRYVRTGSKESFGMVAAVHPDTYYQANPIRYKQQGKSTEWTDSVQINFDNPLQPSFSWVDGKIKENVIYFQVISNANGDLLSGTYTTDLAFTYQDSSNVVFDINRTWPQNLESGQEYKFTLMAVSIDNWVNMVIQRSFWVP